MVIPLDKLFHLMGGYIIAITLAPFGLWWALGVCTVIAGLKELIWDWLMKKGTPEWLDFLATVAGGVAAILVHSVLIVEA